MIALLAFAALTQAVVRTDVPVAEFNVTDLGFTCAEDGLPTVTVEYANAVGQLTYGQFDPRAQLMFHLPNSVRTVVHEAEGANRRWIIHAEGPAQRARGLADGTPAAIDLIVHLSAEGRLTGDFAVRAGSFSRSGTACRRMPPRTVTPEPNP
jgi:hypothetical protein